MKNYKQIKGIVFIFFLLSSTGVFSQNLVRGKVVDSNNEPLLGVNILLKGTNKGSGTDFSGNFEIKQVQENQVLVVSAIGYKTREFVLSDLSSELVIVLYEGNELLQEIVIKSERQNKFSRKKTAYVSKLPLKDLENTVVYSTVTDALLESQIVTDLDGAMLNAAGVYKLWESTGRDPGNGTSFYSMRGFSVQPRLVDGIAGVTFSAVEPSYLERIEVIKGPTATLFGSTETSLGGLINVVTKKPFKGTGGTVSYTFGSFGLHRISADYNTPLGKGDNVFFRVNASYLTQGSFQDAGFRSTYFIAPSVSFKVNNRLNISAGFEFSRTKQTNPSMLFLRRGFPLVSKNVDEMNVNPRKSFTSNDIYLTNPVFNTRLIGDYKVSDNWTSQTVFSSTYAKTTGNYQYQFDGGAGGLLLLNSINVGFSKSIAKLQEQIDAIANPTNPQSVALQKQLGQVTYVRDQVGMQLNPMLGEASGLLAKDAFTRVYSRRDSDATQFNIQQNFIGDFKLGNVRNRMVIGADYFNKISTGRNKSGHPDLLRSSNFPQLTQTLNTFGLSDISTQIASSFSQFPYFDAFLSPNGTVIPSRFTPNATYTPTKVHLDHVFDRVTADNRKFKSQVLAVYASDVINITPALAVNIGLRLDHFIQDGRVPYLGDNNPNYAIDNYTKTTFSPSAGILYQPLINKISLFANYKTGFTNVDPTVDYNTGKTKVFKPQQAKQFEGGIKTNLFRGKLNLGASYYHITVNDFVTSDPSAPIFPVNTDVAEVLSQGYELEINAAPIAGLNIRTSFSKNDMKYTDVTSKLSGRKITELADRRPGSAGPEMLYNFWADYKFPEGSFAKNFGVGIGFNGASEHLTTNDAVTGIFTLPPHTVFNAGLYYNADKFRIGVKANNFTDKIYYTGWSTINAQAPRAFLGTITYKFKK